MAAGVEECERDVLSSMVILRRATLALTCGAVGSYACYRVRDPVHMCILLI